MLMKRKCVFQVLCGLLAVGMLLMTGCSRLPTVTLDQLMEEVNIAHQTVDNDGLKKQFILRQPIDENGDYVYPSAYYTYPEDTHPYDPNLVLTRQQLEEDTVYLFDASTPATGTMSGWAAGTPLMRRNRLF